MKRKLGAIWRRDFGILFPLINTILQCLVAIALVSMGTIPYFSGPATVVFAGLTLYGIYRHRPRKPAKLPTFVTGWRIYSLHYTPLTTILYGAAGNMWPTNTFEAICGCAASSKDHILSRDATCGVYIYKERPEDDPGIIAAVIGWGRGYEYTEGYRMEFCRIEHLYLSQLYAYVSPELYPLLGDIKLGLEERYKVEVE